MMYRILLVEDTLSDAELVKEALLDAKMKHTLTIVHNGEEAVELLKNTDTRPHIILLDLNLPRKSGIEVLEEIRRDSDPSIKTIPVIVLTNSRSTKDVDNAYSTGCNAYINKPLSYEDLLATMQATHNFWFKYATLPSELPERHSDLPEET